MRRPAMTAALLSALVALTGCGAGGFGNREPTQIDTAITNYVALGDGFAAAPYVGSGSSKDGCLRSSKNYPALLLKDLGVKAITDVTCTGATMRSITDPGKVAGRKGRLKPQIDAVTKETDLITINVGIEDRGLINDMYRVCLALPCGSDVPAAPLIRQLKAYGTSLSTAIRTMKNTAPTAYIVLVGYPQIMPESDSCSGLPAMTTDKLGAARLVLDELNRQIQAAARQTDSVYVDVSSISQDHTVCSDEPWMSSKKSKPGKVVAYHPLAVEQRAVAGQIADQVRSR